MASGSREERRRLGLFAGLAVAFSLLACCGIAVMAYNHDHLMSFALLLGVAAGCCTLGVCAAMAAIVHYQDAQRRLRVERMAERLNAILHDTASVQSFDDYDEGELAILANELQKMCTLLRDQAQELRHERDGLADSLADISHQMRTPLMAMNLVVELLGRPDTSPERRRALVCELRDLSATMNWLVSSLLTLARADAGTLRLTCAPVDVARLLQEATDPLRIAFELNDQTLEVVCTTVGATFEGDAGWCREALANIVKNCMEHTPAGGTVRVEACQDVVATRIVVTDTGPGISARDLPHVFERFYKGEGSSKNSVGIGLALARCLVTAQDGTLTAGNAVGGGARFVMTFPRVVV